MPSYGCMVGAEIEPVWVRLAEKLALCLALLDKQPPSLV